MTSKREHKQSSCEGKQVLTREVALRIAKKTNGMQPYRCNFCLGWHVGSSIRPRGKRNV